MRRKSIVLAVCMLAIVFCPASTAFAQEQNELPAPGITPDSPLYLFDELAEQFSLRFTFQQEARLEKALQYAEEKISEMNHMIARNNIRATIQAMNAYNNRINAAMESVDALGNQGASTHAILAFRMAKHITIFDDIEAGIPGEARLTMIRIRERACICQQMVLQLMEQEDPEMANKLKLKLREQQRNSVRVMAGEEETTNVQEDSRGTKVSGEQDPGEDTIQLQGNKKGQPDDVEQGVGLGHSSDGEGPGLENHWSSGAGGQGPSWGETSEGEVPNLENHWVHQEE